MSRNTLFFLLITLLIVGGLGLGIYFYFYSGAFANFGGGRGVPSSVKDFLPFGSFGGGAGGGTSGESGGATGGTGAPELNRPQAAAGTLAPRLFKLSQNPVAGYTASTVASSTLVRYQERETGRVFEIDMSIPSARTRITNTTIPRVRETFFGPNAGSLILRYLNSDNVIETYFANIPKATSTEDLRSGAELKGVFLPENIMSVTLSPSTGRMFTLANFGNSALGTVSDLDGGKKSQIFDSPFTEWLPSWTSEKTILLATKPSASAAGYAYALDAKSGTLQKVYGGTAGLTALLSPDGAKLLLSEDSDGGLTLKTYRLTNRSLNDTGLKTMTDKCVWASAVTVYCAVPNNIPVIDIGYPDAWYLGVVSFTDSLWKIDTETLSTDQVSQISQVARENIDAVNLGLDKNGDYLFFVNKRDSSLWALKLL